MNAWVRLLNFEIILYQVMFICILYVILSEESVGNITKRA